MPDAPTHLIDPWFDVVDADGATHFRERRRLTALRALVGGATLAALTSAGLIAFTVPDMIDARRQGDDPLTTVWVFVAIGLLIGLIAATRALLRPAQWEVSATGLRMVSGARFELDAGEITAVRCDPLWGGRTRLVVVARDENVYALGTPGWHIRALDGVAARMRHTLDLTS